MRPLPYALLAAFLVFPAAAQSLCGRMVTPAAQIRELSSGFGQRGGRLHSGIDLTGPRGTPIRAAADGVVVWAGRYYAYGNMVDIRHRDGTVTRYGHMASIARGIRPGEPVRAGATLGAMGATGRASGVHLHFEVRVDGAAVDPRPWLALASCEGAPAADGLEVAQAPARRRAHRRR